MNGRDLSAFKTPRTVSVAPPPSHPQARADGAGGEVGPEPENPSTAAITSQPKRRVMVSLPARLSRRLREAAEQDNCFQTDLVLGAYVRQREAVLQRYAVEAVSGSELPPRPRSRRRRVEDRTQFVMYCTDQERQVLDGFAQRLGISRSELVTALLEQEFGNDR